MNSDSASRIGIKCPQCGEKTFKFESEPNVESGAAGGICSGCGHVLTDDDIRAQALEVAKAQLKSSLVSAFGKAFKPR